MNKLTNTYTLQNGLEIPCIGFGTYKLTDPDIAYRSVLDALNAGYTHIDAAAIYGNEESVGKAINDSGIARNEIFLTTKLWNDSHTYDKALKAIDASLKRLQTDYVDLYLVHWPNPKQYRDDYIGSITETWKAMEKIYKDGKAKAIGISNFRPHHIEQLLEIAEIAPMVNQLRLYPGYEMSETVKNSKSHGMLVQAHSPLGSGKIFESSELASIAEKYNKTIAQICIRYSLQKGYLPLPKSANTSRIKENIQVFDFVISNEDMEFIENIPNYCSEGSDPDNCDF